MADGRPGPSEADVLSSLSGLVQSGFTLLSVSLGSKLGLFRILLDAKNPLTSHQLADAAGYKERYVREWLGCMVTARLVTTDSDSATFWLSDAHKAALQSAENELLLMSELLPLLAGVDDKLRSCFQKGGPAGIVDEDLSAQYEWERKFTASIDVTPDITPLIDYSDQTRTSLERGSRVLDVGCGPGKHTITLARMFPNSTFGGIDLSNEGISEARREAESQKVANATFEVRDIYNLPQDWSNSFDYVTFFYCLHDLGKPTQALAETWRVLKTGGILYIKDGPGHTKPSDNLGSAWSSTYYTFSLFFCLPRGLGEGPEGPGAMWGVEEESKVIKAAGFDIMKVERDDHKNTYICRK